TSYNRHTSYCRRAHNRPRTRTRSCRSCSTAKAKCSFQPRCLRCTNKGLDCIYDNTTTSRPEQLAEEEATPEANGPVFTPSSSSSMGGDFTFNDMFATAGQATNNYEAQSDMDWDSLGFSAADMLPPTPKSNLPRFQEPLPDFMSNGPLHFDQSGGRRLVDSLPIPHIPDNMTLVNYPDCTWPAEAEPSLAIAGSADVSQRPSTDFLARLPIIDPVFRFTGTLIMQMLRSFPQMMLRRETLPPYMHGHWHRHTSVSVSLPEPLVNCMGIAQVFASNNLESKPFLWRSIKMEQRSFVEREARRQFSREDFLAAVQAQIMYIIMRVIDDSKFDSDINQSMLVTHSILCEGFRNMCNQPFCQDERLYPSSSWEDWIFAESRRRTLLVWFMIAHMVQIKTGVHCDVHVSSAFRSFPLSSPKSLWEAKTRSAWQAEYDEYTSMQRMDLDVLGDLIDAHRQSDVRANRRKLDTWNSQSDNLGILVTLGVAMIQNRTEAVS
ncbi:hypothetical protein LSUE1_G001156, partial [Lachnellula suecica]